MKVMTVLGTRPEIIRLSRIMVALDTTPGIDHVVVHTGQNWDRQLRDVFFDELNLRHPDHSLGIDVSSLGAAIGDVFRQTERVLLQEQPDAFLVLGDTNSALSLIMAKRLGIPTYHLEAGNRCFDENVPEETNRRVIDHAADFNLAYTEHARRNLLSEGLHPRRILVTGSPMKEVLDYYLPDIERSDVLDRAGVSAGQFFIFSAHREETVDDPVRLSLLMSVLEALRAEFGLPVLVSTHPRTLKRLAVLDQVPVDPGIEFCEPFGFLDYIRLQMSAACALSDSGTIAEEASILGFPAVTLRMSIERPEALDTGSIIMTDVGAEDVVSGVRLAMGMGPSQMPQDYEISNTSQRVIAFLMSTVHSHGEWTGIRKRKSPS